MLVVKVELWPKGQGGDRVRELGRLVICNTGSSRVAARGDYVARLMRRGSGDRVQKEGVLDPDPAHSRELFELFESVGGPAPVQDYPRLAYPVWALVGRALRALRVPGV